MQLPEMICYFGNLLNCSAKCPDVVLRDAASFWEFKLNLK